MKPRKSDLDEIYIHLRTQETGKLYHSAISSEIATTFKFKVSCALHTTRRCLITNVSYIASTIKVLVDGSYFTQIVCCKTILFYKESEKNKLENEQEIQTRTNEEETVSENSRTETLAQSSEKETQTETDGDSSFLETDSFSDGEVISVSKKEARKFMKPLLAEDIYKKYFHEIRITFWTWLNRLFCCQSILRLKNQAKGRNELYSCYLGFLKEYNSVTTEQEKKEVEESCKKYFRNWNESDIEELGESDSRQHVQALLLIFLFYLQQVALILVGDENIQKNGKRQ
eukprot:snap_masked-scaffold_8-processed-gene-12.47-mRNA-1 protein AED:1.00 eAED:1.00 QI:0/0/0/0/1/1/2/0/285